MKQKDLEKSHGGKIRYWYDYNSLAGANLAGEAERSVPLCHLRINDRNALQPGHFSQSLIGHYKLLDDSL